MRSVRISRRSRSTRAEAIGDPKSLHKLSAWTKITRAAFIAQLKEIADSFPLLPDAQNEKQSHICLFVHGFNTSWTDAVDDYLDVKNSLIEPANLGLTVLYSWPSKGSVAGYLPDREDARESAPDLAQLFVDLNDYLVKKQRVAATTNDPEKLCKAKVSVIAHSMGALRDPECAGGRVEAAEQPAAGQPDQPARAHRGGYRQRSVPARQAQSDGDGSLMANLCYRIAALYTGLDSVLGMSAGLKHFGTRRLGRSGLSDRNEGFRQRLRFRHHRVHQSQRRLDPFRGVRFDAGDRHRGKHPARRRSQLHRRRHQPVRAAGGAACLKIRSSRHDAMSCRSETDAVERILRGHADVYPERVGILSANFKSRSSARH